MVTTVYRNAYLPDRYLVDCPGAEWTGGTFRDVGELAAMRKTALQNCNDRLAEARRYQAELRAKEDQKAP